MAQYTKQQLISASNATYFTNVNGGISASAVRDLNDSWISSSALLSGSNTFIGNQIISGNLDITGTITASLQTGYLYVGDSSGKTQAVATSSIIANTNTGSLLVTASFDTTTRDITFTKGDATTFKLGAFATTGSNTFQGNQFITGNVFITGSALTIQRSQKQIRISPVNNFIEFANLAEDGGNDFYISSNPSSSLGISTNTPAFVLADTNVNAYATIVFQNSASYTDGRVSVLTPLSASAGFTASLQNGYAWVGNSLGQNTQVATSSFGTSINTGSFATTGSNTFIGNQIISGNVLPLVDGQGDLGTDTYKWNKVVVNGELKGSSLNTNGRGAVGTLRVGDETFPLSFLSDREIVGDGSGANTHMYYGTSSADVTGLREFVYAQSGSDANFTSVSASFNTRINAATIDTGSFATTGSNTFNGDQIVNGKLTISSSANSYLQFTSPNNQTGSGQIFFGSLGPYIQTFSGAGNQDGMGLQLVGGLSGSFAMATRYGGPNATIELDAMDDQTNPSTTRGRIQVRTNGQIDLTGFGGAISLSGSQTFIQGLRYPGTDGTNGQVITTNGSGQLTFTTITGSGGGTGSIDTGSFATTGSNTFIGGQIISQSVLESLANLTLRGNETSLDLSGSNSYIKQTGVLWFRNQSGATGFRETNFVTRNNVINFGADNGFYFARTDGAEGVNSFGAVKMNTISGSLVLAPNSFSVTTGSLLHLSSSSNITNVNLIFKNNDNTADTIISGSNNIFTNPAAATAGFKRYIGGSNNIINTTASPQISGSMQFSPNIAQNYLTATAFIMRGPVSSSTWSISNNVIQGNLNIGSSAANNAEKAVAGFTFTGNSVNGTFNFVANKTLLTQGNSISNNLFTNTTLTAASSSIIYSNNIGGISITNSASGGLVSNGANAIYVNQNLFVGSNNFITTTGSQDPGDTGGASFLRQIDQTQILGSSNGVNLPYAPTGSNSLNQTIIAGYSLGVTGSNASSFSGLTQNGGSAFFGRYNAQDGNRAQSAQTIFAVGTGTSTTRKTGFLIDSGSNSYFEGTLNVSGSTSLNGNLIITGSLTASLQQGFVYVGNASGITTTVSTSSLGGGTIDTGSFATTGSNTFNGNQTITGSVSITGSLTTTGNMFQVTGSFNTFGNVITQLGVFTSSLAGGLEIDGIGYVGSGSAGAFFINSTTQDIKIQNYYSSSVNGKNIVIENFSQTGSGGIHGKVALRARGTGGAVTVENTSQFRVECQTEITGSLIVSGSLVVSGNQTLQSFTTLASVSSSLNFADDTAAAAGGVPLGGLYRNGNFVMIRLT